jgi:hypothetical protein
MRTFSNPVKTILSSDEVSVVYLVKIVIDQSTTWLDTTAPFSVIFDNNTYVSSSSLMTVEAPRLSEVVDREPYKIVYTDPQSDILSAFEGGLTGSIVEVYAVFYNTMNTTLNSVVPGELMLDPADVLTVYKGTVDSHGIVVDPSNGTILATIEAGSPVSNLARPKAFYSSKDSMRLKNPSDTAFDDIFLGGEDSAIRWGKA